MDKKLSPEFIRKRRNRRIINIALIVAIIVAVFVVLTSVLRSGISRNDVYTSVVDRGSVEISIAAAGKIVPLSEEVIVSPVSTRILEVYKKAGEVVDSGETILRLDLATISADIENQRDELAMKRYKLEQQRQASESKLSDLAMQINIDEMRIKRMEVLLRNERYLDSIGAGTSDKILQAELDYDVELLKLQQLRLKYDNESRNAVSEEKVLELDYSIALKNANLNEKRLSEARVRSPRRATLTMVNDQIGSQVAEGSQLAIVSDLNHYKVDAEISDSYGSRISSGQQVIVKISDVELSGVVGNIVPSVKDGLINFTVSLSDNAHPLLRSGLKTDVYVINSIEADALRISRRSYYSGAGEYDLWVVEGDIARKRKVILGESSYGHVVVKEGLKEGETVIISDMTRYYEKNTIRLK